MEQRIAPAVMLGNLDGNNGFTVHGVAVGDYSGRVVSAAGDVNGDGFDDILIGAAEADPNGNTDSGSSYVVFGQAGGFAVNMNLSLLDGTNGFRLDGAAAGDSLGYAVSAAGDVNGDGFDDILIGAAGAHPNGNANSGSSYVVFGKSGGFAANMNLSSLNGTNGFRLDGIAAGDRSGSAVSAAGDVNGDGFDDILIGAAGANANSGSSYVVFGKSGGFAANMNLSSLNGTNGFRLNGVAVSDYSGAAVSAAGDVNGDGFDDILIGAVGADPNGNANSGSSYVVFGKSGGFAANMNLSSLNGTNGFRLAGVAAGDYSGYAVSAAGDVNGDGFDDILIGAAGAHPNGNAKSGSSYVVFGKSGSFAANINLSSLNGTNGFRLDGAAASDYSGGAVSAAGDVNGDGFDDILIGAFGADPNGNADSGSSYVVFGKSGSFAANMSLSSLNGNNGFRLDGVAANDYSGRAVSAAGDVNGDGFNDIIIGADGAGMSGSSYVVYGSHVDVTSTDLHIAAGGKSATFTDVDGDLVTIKVSKGTIADFGITLAKCGVGAHISSMDLSSALSDLTGANITVSAKAGALGGDGFTNIGFLDANGVDLGSVKIDGDLGHIHVGDVNQSTAAIKSLTTQSMGEFLTIGGDRDSIAVGALSKLTVKQSIQGVSLKATSIGAVLAGSIDGVSGFDTMLYSDTTIKSIKVRGDLGGDSDALVQIIAQGNLNPVAAKLAQAIGSITIGGNVKHSQILAGFDMNVAAVNSDVQIGKIVVNGNWTAANISAGIDPGAGNKFGDNNDSVIAGGNAISSRIASIVIKGQAIGSSDASENFGIEAQQIGSATIGKAKVPLTSGIDKLQLGSTSNFRMREFA